MAKKAAKAKPRAAKTGRTKAPARPKATSGTAKPRRTAKRPREQKSAPEDLSQSQYEARLIRSNNKSRDQAADKREIGPLPSVENAKRRAACEQDFGKFLRTYWPADTRHPWSDVHLKLITTIEMVVLVGALLAMGIPRGWGKTFLSVRAIIWAAAFRHHTMMMLIAASDDAAADLLQDIVDELETNELLQADFPELCHPIACLQGIRQRQRGQTLNGQRTKVKVDRLELHLGDIDDEPGVVIFAGGICGSKIRGRRKKRGDRIERPTLGLVDDFQTRASAGSRLQCQKRLNIVSDDIPGLPGNDQAWSCLLTCTVIEPGDAADQLLDRQQHPDWRGIRAAFLNSLPNQDAFDHWEEWNRIRVEDLQGFDENPDDIEQETISERAHAYYRKFHKPMNAGADVGWKYAYKPEHYVDALEKAMHWYFRSRRGFWSELQNQPDKFEVSALPQLQAHLLIHRVHHCRQLIAPADAEYLTAHADLSKAVLWFELRAWALDSTSWTIDYGTWPKQNRAYFTQATARYTIDSVYQHLPTWSIRCMAAIRDLFTELFALEVQREDGATLRLNIAGIDANDETDTVRKGIRKAGLSGRLWPMHSRSFRPPKTALNDLPKKDGDVIGESWRRRKPENGHLRYITYDTDLWKSHHRNRLLMPAEAPGAITWFVGGDHKMIADHHSAEYSETLFHEASGRRIEIWGLKPGEDNHLWDVGVGNDVLGSVLGLKLPADAMLRTSGTKTAAKGRKRRRKLKVTL